MIKKLDELSDLYKDNQTCAKLIGLSYVEAGAEGLTRLKHGQGFRYQDSEGKPAAEAIKRRIAELVIPPAWQEVWICPSDTGHILATGLAAKKCWLLCCGCLITPIFV